MSKYINTPIVFLLIVYTVMTQEQADKYEKTSHNGPNYRKYSNRNREIDVHELLRNEINKQGTESIDSGGSTTSRVFSAESSQEGAAPKQAQKEAENEKAERNRGELPIGVADKYFLFKSGDATGKNLSVGEFTYSIVDRNFGFPINNIIEMEIGEFYLPTIPVFNFGGMQPYPSAYFYNRMTMLIKNIAATQSITSINNYRYHFEFDVNSPPTPIPLYPTISQINPKLVPVKSLYIFSQPVRSLNEITIRFAAPDIPITLPEERLILTPVPGSTPATFLLPANHNLLVSTYYAIYFENYIPNDPATTDVLINRVGGHIGLTNNPITSIALSAMGISMPSLGPAESAPATIIVGQNSFAFTIRFRTISDERTNYITPV